MLTHTDTLYLWLATQDHHKIKLLKHSKMKQELTPAVSPPAEELMTVDGSRGRESHFSKCGKWVLVVCPCLSGGPHTGAHKGRTN